MSKEEFLNGLRERLSFLPREDAEERLAFYSEMIDDRVEEGMTEEEAIASIGMVDGVTQQVMSEIPLSTLMIRKVKPKKPVNGGVILALVLGAPIWISLLIAFFSVMFSVYVAVWSIAFAVFAVAVSFMVSAVALFVAAFFYLFSGRYFVATFVAGAAMVMTGLSILAFIGGIMVSKAVLKVTGKFLLWVKSWFVRKEPANEYV